MKENLLDLLQYNRMNERYWPANPILCDRKSIGSTRPAAKVKFPFKIT